MKTISKVNINSKAELLKEYWDPKIIGELNGQHIKIAKFKGEFINHKHDNEDELFLVLKGKMRMVLENETIDVLPGEFIIIPKGTIHKPVGLIETEVLLFEPKTTLNTGNVKNALTKENLEEI